MIFFFSSSFLQPEELPLQKAQNIFFRKSLSKKLISLLYYLIKSKFTKFNWKTENENNEQQQ